MRTSSFSFAGALVAAVFVSSPNASYGAFTDVTASTGIAHVHSRREDGFNNHAGGAAFDVNGDGYTDLLLAKVNAAPALFVNNGNGGFVNETATRGLSGAVNAAAFGAGDLDNDGDIDLVVVPHSGPRYYLYLNDGSGRFEEVGADRGMDLGASQPHFGYSVGLVDYDLDGFLDVYVSEWGVPSGSEPEQHSVLLRNGGATAPGYFENVTVAAGLVQLPARGFQYGFSSAWADFDGDGWPDLALVADYGLSRLYWNNGNGTFLDGTVAAGVGKDENGMGVAVADYDGDGLLDFYVTSIFDYWSFNRNGSYTGNKLYRNLGDRRFEEVSERAGVNRTGWGWGTAFLDQDNDGDFDLVATNGSNLAEGGNRETTPFVDAGTDATTLFENLGDGTFTRLDGSVSGIVDNAHGKGLVVWDYDRDGDEDLVVINSFSNPVVYRNDASANGNDWLRLTFEGTISNRSAYGTTVRVTRGGKTQTLVYNPTNAYIGQREAALHFGLGPEGGPVESVEVTWPTGLEQRFAAVAANQVLHLLEPADEPTPPRFARQPELAGSFTLGEALALEVSALGTPSPAIVWEKDGVVVEGASGGTLQIKRVSPWDAGTYRAKAVSSGGEALSQSVEVVFEIDTEERSVARWWNEFMLEAIRRDFPNPTKHGRNLYHVSAALWDGFWTYEDEGWSKARPVFWGESVEATSWAVDPVSGQPSRKHSQTVAMSHAAYGVLKARYATSPGAARSLFGFRWLMERLGCDPDDAGVVGPSPAAVGNRIARAVLERGYLDGSNELGGYADTSGYAVSNPPLFVKASGILFDDLNRWQPLAFDFAVSQNGIPLGALTQTFLGVNWREVSTFALKKPTANTIAFDPGPPPLMGEESQADFVASAVEVIRYSSLLDPESEEMIDISPGAYLNNPLGSNEGVGYPMNPYTGQPYAANEVRHADYGRILAEYWADGPASETPPGHWNSIFNQVSDHPLLERRYMGAGPELSQLEWDVRGYLALNGGMHDAAVAAWTLKRQYDYSRPITMIRGLASNGQSSDPSLPSYSAAGLPLIPGLIEVVTAESSAAGGRHEGLALDVGRIAVRSWKGEPTDPHTQAGGVGWILAESWLPYQRSTFVTPAFAAYVSGHSTFSRTGAEVLGLLTGSPYFPGGLGEYHFAEGRGLEFEYGPSGDVTLQWATYYDAADQAGLSRLYGGIHVRADDFIGRTLGARVGVEAFVKAHSLRNAAEGTGRIARAVINGAISHGSDRPLTEVRTLGPGLPMRVVGSLDDAKGMPGPGLAFVLPEPMDAEHDGGRFGVVAQGGDIVGASVGGELGAGEALELEFEVEAAEPALVLVFAQGEGGVDARLVLWIWQDGIWQQLAANDDWRQSSASSLTEVLLRREGAFAAHGDSDAAVAVALRSGLYRATLVAEGGVGVGRLSIRGQSWAE